MSWSLTKKASRAEAREAFTKVFQEQGAYSIDGAHKSVMDECAKFAGDVAEASPEGSDLTISSYGQINADGTGQASVSVGIGKPAPTS